MEVLLHLLGSLRELHTFADKKAYAALTIFGAIGLGAPLYVEKVIKSVGQFHFFWQNLVVLLMIVFFGVAAKLELDILKKEWKTQTDEELHERLVANYRNASIIANTKFVHSKFALQYATIAIVLFSIITAFSFNFESNKQTLNNSNPIPTIQIEGNQTK